MSQQGKGQQGKGQLPSFDKLVAEAKAFEAKRKLQKKPKKKTQTGEKRMNVLLVKQMVNDHNYKILSATKAPHHIHVFSRLEHCHSCHEEQHTVQRITVVEEDRAGNHYMSADLDINSHAMLMFQRRELPIQFSTDRKIIPACHYCLLNMADEPARKEA